MRVALWVCLAWGVVLGCGCDGSSSGGSDDLSGAPGEPAELKGITSAHNQVRKMVDVGPLEWDEDLEAYAAQWAEELAGRGCPLEHRPRSGEFAQEHGENLSWNAGRDWTPQEVVNNWASEEANYNYAANSCAGVCGHYTQVVWEKSLRVGCAMRRCDDAQLWVCNYDPAGNFVGEKPY